MYIRRKTNVGALNNGCGGCWYISWPLRRVRFPPVIITIIIIVLFSPRGREKNAPRVGRVMLDQIEKAFRGVSCRQLCNTKIREQRRDTGDYIYPHRSRRSVLSAGEAVCFFVFKKTRESKTENLPTLYWNRGGRDPVSSKRHAARLASFCCIHTHDPIYYLSIPYTTTRYSDENSFRQNGPLPGLRRTRSRRG